MLPVAINHMTLAKRSFAELLDVASQLGCCGVELRNDLSSQLFDGLTANDAGNILREKNLRLLAIAEVKQFNDWSDAKFAEAEMLMKIAVEAGAEAVTLIPRNDGWGLGNGERQANLRLALRELKPMLDSFGLIGLLEPLGFKTCSLRHKAEAIEAIEAVGASAQFKLVHDTFHHYLAGDDQVFAEHTGIVHISGVVDARLSIDEMADEHRILVDQNDRIGNVDQLRDLTNAGYCGPVSFEAFAAEIHDLKDPGTALSGSLEFISSHLSEKAA